MIRKTISNIARPQLITLAIAVGVGMTANCFNHKVIAQTTSQNNPSVIPIANVNEVKTFVYSWFALLDRQVSAISLLKFLDRDNLIMEFPEMTVNNPDDFNEWYLGVQEQISSNIHDVRQVEVTPKDNGEFEIVVEVDWQAQTRQGKAIERSYQQQWTIVTDPNRRLLIQEYLVEELK